MATSADDSAPAPTPGARAPAARREPAGTTEPVPPVWVAPGVRLASEWAWRLGVVAVALYGLTLIVARFSEIVVPLVVAMLLAALLYPLVALLSRFMPRGLAALVTLLGTVILVVGLFTLVGQQASSGFPRLSEQAEEGLNEVRVWLRTGPLNIDAGQFSDYLTQAQQAAKDNQSKLVSGAVGVAGTLSHVVEGLFITLFATFFFLSSGHRIWAWTLNLFPGRAQSPVDDAARSGWVTLSHYVRATVLVALIDGIGIGLGVALLGVPLAFPLGVLVFLGAFIPIVGALITGALAVLVALVANGPVIALAVLGVVLLVQQIESHVLQPFLMGRAVNVHPLAVILGIAAGASLAGIVGALFAVPTIAVTNTVISSLARRRDPGEEIAEQDKPLAPDMPPETDPAETPDPQTGEVLGGDNDDAAR